MTLVPSQELQGSQGQTTCEGQFDIRGKRELTSLRELVGRDDKSPKYGKDRIK